MKRWNTDEPPTPSSPAAGGLSGPDFSLPHGNHVLSASYSLLPEEEREAYQTSGDSVMVVISLLRLRTLLSPVRSEYGNQVTNEYFDCTINLRYQQRTEIVHNSVPKNCKNSDLPEGNVHVYYFLSEGYGCADLSRLSAAMGVKELTPYTFARHAKYLYKEMDTYCKEQESATKECTERAYENIGKERDKDEKRSSDISFDGTWFTRGHKSHIGAAFVMGMYSRMLIDFEVLSNFCAA